jgi:putative effector of murein hydrolase
MRCSRKPVLAAMVIAAGILLILGSPLLPFADEAKPLFRAVRLAQAYHVCGVGQCREIVEVRHVQAFALVAATGVMAILFGTHLFVRSRRVV